VDLKLKFSLQVSESALLTSLLHLWRGLRSSCALHFALCTLHCHKNPAAFFILSLSAS